MIKFVIEDERHAEHQGEYNTYEEALSELIHRSKIDWDQKPNKCPCRSWKTCGRDYQILRYDCSTQPYWTLLETTPVISISAEGTVWAEGF